MQKPALLVFVLGTILASSTPAAVVEDPKGLLANLNASRTRPEFSEAYKLGDEITLRIFNQDCHFGCGADGCGAVCTEVNADFTRKIVEGTPDEATAVTSDGTSQTFARSDFESAGKQFLVPTLENLDVFLGMKGKVVLDSLTPIDAALGDGTTVPALDLKGRLVTAENSMIIEFHVAKGGSTVPGLAEVLFEKIDAMKMFRVKSFARVAP
jgi:hypothetical protein